MAGTNMEQLPLQRFSECVRTSAEAGSLINLVFSSSDSHELLKIKGVLKVIGGSRCLQLEYHYSEGRVAQKNLPYDSVGEILSEHFGTPFFRIDLNDVNGSAALMMSKKGKVTAVIPSALRAHLDNSASRSITNALMTFQKNDRVKNRILQGNEPFLIALGISDANGRVHDKRQAKFRQICRFSELVLESVKYLPQTGTLHIADLCCGKSYLSFAVYHVLKFIAHRDVEMICIDLKQSVMDYCEECARKMGFDGMHFLCADISEYVPACAPDMVISLHACDVATDIVLDFAAKWRASVILSTPCCQRELSTKLACESLRFIAERPILRKKFCDAATDALRLLRLECQGYTADAIEFIDPEDTPKNIMLRAYRKKRYNPHSDAIRKKRDEYSAAYRFLCGDEPAPFSELQTDHDYLMNGEK
ncbi:MAG: SAM-dependent methyltransferase [Ruminococcus sp.]|nr:SAM-dependent methyltransferase [Clostridia bacterium]MBQ8906501.1 SAM-dependent methyltransferase [Ruminococcus sp.]